MESVKGLKCVKCVMNDVANPMNRESHFEFGKNWASYVRLVTDAHV